MNYLKIPFLFISYFDDGYLGSTGHGACYYEDDIDGIEEIKSEDDLMCLVLDEEHFDSWSDDEEIDEEELCKD